MKETVIILLVSAAILAGGWWAFLKMSEKAAKQHGIGDVAADMAEQAPKKKLNLGS